VCVPWPEELGVCTPFSLAHEASIADSHTVPAPVPDPRRLLLNHKDIKSTKSTKIARRKFSGVASLVESRTLAMIQICGRGVESFSKEKNLVPWW
jgi:hypothetical protein